MTSIKHWDPTSMDSYLLESFTESLVMVDLDVEAVFDSDLHVCICFCKYFYEVKVIHPPSILSKTPDYPVFNPMFGSIHAPKVKNILKNTAW